MLVLQRTVGEQVQIGSGIVITVVQNARGRIRIGIDAPEGTSIRRGELEPTAAEPNPALTIAPTRPNKPK